jgi:hypothetical protein
MGLDLNFNSDATVLSEEEKEGLLIRSITTGEELDEFEQQNIEQAVEFYLLGRKYKAETILTEKFIFEVHKNKVRDTYIKALQTADKGNFEDLIKFSMQ